MNSTSHPGRPVLKTYLGGYPSALVAQVERLIERGEFGALWLDKYPQAHTVRTDKALYDYVLSLKNDHLRTVGPLSKVAFDNKLHVVANALGTHTTVARVQGAKLKTKREIRVASVFKDMPEPFLRMIAVHELAHMKVAAHDKAFYQLCLHMEPDYHRLEFDLRAYLAWLEAGGERLWRAAPGLT